MLLSGLKTLPVDGRSERIAAVCGDGEEIPAASGKFWGVTVAFGVRNLARTEKGLAEMLRVLKPNGHLVLFDIVSPQWAKSIRLGEFGVITLDGLDALIDEHQLDVVYTGRSGLFYKLVVTG